MFTSIARSLFNTLESINTPCSLEQKGGYRNPILSVWRSQIVTSKHEIQQAVIINLILPR